MQQEFSPINFMAVSINLNLNNTFTSTRAWNRSIYTSFYTNFTIKIKRQLSIDQETPA